jgi:hypothetical protein
VANAVAVYTLCIPSHSSGSALEVSSRATDRVEANESVRTTLKATRHVVNTRILLGSSAVMMGLGGLPLRSR